MLQLLASLVLAMTSSIASSRTASALSSPRAVIIFCHGSGDSGTGVKSYVESVASPASLAALRRAGVEFEFPSARPRPYRLAGGRVSSVWYDRIGGMDPRNAEDAASVEPSARQLNDLIDEVVERTGVPEERIALGGFSMGGGVALQAAARRSGRGRRLGAVFALSSYLCDDSRVWTELESQRGKECSAAGETGGREQSQSSSFSMDGTSALLTSPVFMAHGTEDDFVPPSWGEQTAIRLRDSGADLRGFELVPGAGHEMIESELSELFAFLLSELVRNEN